MTTVRLGHLYPEEMNIYADRGNIAVLALRCSWRGLSLEVTPLRVGDRINPAAHDLYYLGGGQDRDQAVVAQDLLATKAADLRRAVDDGASLLAVCGGYQLAGLGYTDVSGTRLDGLGLLDVDTVAGEGRLIGDVVIEADLDGRRERVVGFENHAGRTTVAAGSRPLGRVVRGHGNNGRDGGEGAVRGRVVGTYLHGPLLPKNPWLADVLLAWALERRTGSRPRLEPLDDGLAASARAVAEERPAKR